MSPRVHTTKPKPPPGFVFIYFFGTEDGREVKLGHSKDAHTRQRQHENASGRYEPVRLLAGLIGTRADESALKDHFALHRSRARSKEWIEAGEEIRDYLRFLRDQPFVATSLEELGEISLVDSSKWLPNGITRKSALQLEIQTTDDKWADLATSTVMEGDYYTHHRITAAARRVMGSIDLDPASCREANRGVQATRFFGARENGLTREWGGNVWINPPFGAWDEWTDKLIREWHSGRVTQLCALASTRTITAKKFAPIVREASAVWIGFGRFEFWGPKAGSPDEGHVVFYFGLRADAFADAFNEIGSVYRNA